MKISIQPHCKHCVELLKPEIIHTLINIRCTVFFLKLQPICIYYNLYDSKFLGLLLQIILLAILFKGFLITNGAIVDQKGGDLEATPLHWAVR